MKKLLLTIKGDRTLSNIEIKETGSKIKNRNPAKYDAFLIRSMAGAISGIISQMPISEKKKREVFGVLIREMTAEFENNLEDEQDE